MEKTAFRRTVITAGVAAAISAGAIALPVFAQSGGSSGTTTTTQGTTTAQGSTTAPSKKDHEARHAEYRAALAKELGVSVDKLEAAEKAARETVFLAHLDEAVADGRISEADAKELRAAAAAGNLSEKLAEQGLERLKTRLDAAVKAGEITQAQADTMLAEAKQRVADGDGFGPGLGRGFGFGGDHGGRGHHGPGGMGGFPGP